MPDDLRPAVRALALLARKLERACGALTLAQYRVLSLVAGGDERSSLLAERLAVAKPTVTAVVDGLVERGYLVREAIEGNRRSVRLRVTDAGRDALGAADAAMTGALAEVCEGVADRDALLAGLVQLHDAWIARVDARLAARR